MKLISYTRCGALSFGAVVEGGIIDLGGYLKADVFTVKSALAHGLMSAADDYIKGRAPELIWSDIGLLPVVPDPSKIFCIGVNYLKHRQETGRPEVGYPTLFTRFADTQVAHRQPLIKPDVSDRFDFEGEMAVIIGRGGRNISKDSALDHVADYACYNDGSIRDWQRHTSQFIPRKTFRVLAHLDPIS